MNDLVVDYSFKARISDVSISLNKVQKMLWKEDRKSYNKIKQVVEDIKKHRETMSQVYIMNDKEMYVQRAYEFLKDFTRIATFIKDKLPEYGLEIDEILNTISMIEVTISMAQHQKSFWAQ